MSGSLEYSRATPAERAAFGSHEALLQMPYELAAPPNRARTVRRIAHEGTTYYFKQFGPTTTANRWTFRMSRPHAQDDAERELLMTLRLAECGIETPRPVLRGRTAGGDSYYVCAELPGRALRDWLRLGPPRPALLALAAAFCGNLLAKGFWLPDLSADHLFARQEVAFFHFGVLDLHNGRMGRPGPPPAWVCRRLLRRFATSVQDLPIGRFVALRFALRLLRNAGLGARSRAILRALPPMDTAARYEQAQKAKAYRDRNPRRTERELDLLAKVFPGQAGERVLDAPCGAGRLLPFLRARGCEVVRADGAFAMLAQAKAAAPALPAVQAHALALPFVDRAFDGVVMFRFLHHLPPSAQKAALAEACRTAARFVVVSFFHPCSAHHLQRRLQQAVRRAAPTRHAITLAALRRKIESHGFALQAVVAERPWFKDLWIACFVRTGPLSPDPGANA